jgi:hypothetical protein
MYKFLDSEVLFKIFLSSYYCVFSLPVKIVSTQL